MFRTIAFASLATLGLLVPTTAQAQLVVSVPLPGLHHYHHHHLYQVQYRTTFWEERAFCDYYEARQFERFQLNRGQEVQLLRHGPDWLVRYGIPSWRTYRTVHSHREAHELEYFLECRGYLARVTHY